MELKQGGRTGLPEEIHKKEYPKHPKISSDMDDTMKGIDETVSRSVGTAKKHMSNQK